MKKSITLLLSCFIVFCSHAQWSNTTNQFYDSLQMPVVTATGVQQNAIVVQSFPDSGYFVLWQDSRATAGTTNLNDIYAQKYDKNGNALWAQDGIPVVATAANEVFTQFTFYGTDPRYKSHACTDSAGGFFVAWETPDNGNSDVRIQHVLPDGSRRFDDAGYILIKRDSATDPINYLEAQLIADGRKGFFISYIRNNRSGGYRDLFVRNYKEENGTLRYNGSGQMDVYGEIQLVPTVCGNRGDLVYPDVNPKDYHIYPDGQGGCNVAFAYYLTGIATTGTNGLVGFNRLCRVKKESHVTTRRAVNLPAVPDPTLPPYNERSFTYKKDTVLQLYNFAYSTYETSCTIGNNAVVVNTNYVIAANGQGFLQASNDTREAQFAKGAVAMADGASNINVNIIAASVRATRTNSSDLWYKRVLVLPQEIYDSIPYELTTDTTHIGYAYRPEPVTPLTKLNEGYDTLLGSASYQDYDFALSASGNRIFATGKLWGPTSAYTPISINMAQMQVDRVAPDSIAVHWHTPKGGTTIGKEVFTSPGAYYGNPAIATDARGNALFSIMNKERLIQVSPIADSARLLWGAMGNPIGAGYYTGTQTYQVYTPVATLSPADGTGVIAFTRLESFGSSVQDIYLRHLDSLNYYNYVPTPRGVSLISPAYASVGTAANPVTLSGLSHTWNYFEGLSATGVQSTMSAVFDDYNLGATTASVLDNTDVDGTRIRRYNGVPYLDRTYAISVENNPNGSASVNVRLYFTTTQFDLLKAADPAIQTPGDLVVIKQPKGTVETPTSYTPVAGEELITPTAWSAVDGGYYVQLPVSSFSYFFIKKSDALLPVRWVNLLAQRGAGNTAVVSWTVANEVNVKDYLVQYSEDGVHYKDGCLISANGSSTYHCTLAAIGSGEYFIKIKSTDLDGKTGYSNTAVIDKIKQSLLFIISPNPVRNDATLRYSVPVAAKAKLRLIAANGTIAWQQSTTLALSGTLTVPMNGLPSGTYNLQVSTGKEVRLLKIVKE